MHSNWRAASLVALSLALSGVLSGEAAYAQGAATSQKEFTPQVGQEGKDVIWVPTPQSLVDRMLQMAGVKPTDFVIDLGAGDGRTVITAAKKFGARALGVEFNPDMVELAKRNAEKEGISGRAQFIRGDIFQTDFTQATVLTLYLLPSLNLKLRPTILRMKPGTRVVSHAFTMGEWEPDQTDSSDGRTAYLWIVPANVNGNWRIELAGGPRYDVALNQQFQALSGGAKADGKSMQLANAKMRGDTISFTLGDREFTGRVVGDRIEGTAKVGGGETKWTATRT